MKQMRMLTTQEKQNLVKKSEAAVIDNALIQEKNTEISHSLDLSETER